MFHIRPLIETDTTRVIEIIENSIKEHGYAFDLSYHRDLLDMCSWYSYPNLALVAVSDSVILGSGAIQFNLDKDNWEIRRLYLAPQARGLGAAKRLMDKLLNHASDKRDIYLTSDEKYTRSHSFYKKYNFEFTGEETITYDPEYSRNFIMKLTRYP